MLYLIYQLIGIVLFLLSFPIVLLVGQFKGNMPYGLDQRYGLGLKSPAKKENGSFRIWIHAASVGEVQAARVIINELTSQRVKCEFFLSTMTIQGRSVACSQLPPEVVCFLAPLDVSIAVRRFLAAIEPDMYICLETELWPAMFIEIHKSGIPSVILNGRMTEGSCRRYRMVRGLMGRFLGNLDGVAVISKEDGERFRSLGAPSEAIRVTGNIKYDYPVENVDEIRQTYREVLQAGKKIVFICGSTRTGEEEILLQVFKFMKKQSGKDILWVIAPRHLERLSEVQRLLTISGLKCDLYSDLIGGKRTSSVVLVNTMGELGQLYSAGDFNFVGGSLVEQRGHNIMEAARWGRPVYYGPSIDDFKDAAEILESGGGAFRVEGGDELAALLMVHLQDKKVYEQACENAAHVVSLQRGAAGRQADMLMNLLPAPS